jgi:hypothetical protein
MRPDFYKHFLADNSIRGIMLETMAVGRIGGLFLVAIAVDQLCPTQEILSVQHVSLYQYLR